jgi:hypothetical protein
MSALSDRENNAIVCFGRRLVFRSPAIVMVGMILSFYVGDVPRRQRSQLLTNMMHTMGRREDQEE